MLTEQEAANALSEMSAQREQERANDAADYRLRKACAARAVELHDLLWHVANRCSVPHEPTMAAIDKLLNEIAADK